MPQTIKLKRSATPGQVPTTAQLDLGEVAINTNDGKFFIRKDDGVTDVVMEIRSSKSGEAANLSKGASAPTDPAPVEGDLWFDTANDKLMYYDGAAWQEVGSDLSSLDVTGNTTLGDAAADTLTVNATADFNAPVNIDGDLTTTANSRFGDDAADTHTFNGNVDMNNNLNVDGTTDLNGNVDLGDATSDTITATGRFDSALVPSTNKTRDLGTASLRWDDIYADSIDLDSNLVVDGTTDLNGNVDLGDATSDTITATGRFDSALVPSTNKTRDLGTTALRWDDIYADSIDLDSNLTVDGTTTLNGSVALGNGADTITINGTNINEYTQDIVGAMVSGNTESGISVAYQDADGTLDFNVNDPTITLSGAVTGSGTMTNLGNVTIATTNTADPTITLSGAVTGSGTMTNLGNVTIATTAASDPTITLSGAVTGSGTMTNLGNVTIATTATADPTLTLSGDLSGSATFTNLGNATLNAQIGANTITATEIAANAVGASEIAANAVGASEIAANAVGASELNVSGNGTAGQALTSDGDGTMSWTDIGGGGLNTFASGSRSGSSTVGATLNVGSANSGKLYVGYTYNANRESFYSGTVAANGDTFTIPTSPDGTVRGGVWC